MPAVLVVVVVARVLRAALRWAEAGVGQLRSLRRECSVRCGCWRSNRQSRKTFFC
jgi:hypothetical protein